MRLWSLHPKYLDAKGLVALWREALLAQAVLLGKTRGYRQHPQLQRFRASASPTSAISAYLAAVCAEAGRRGYAFDASRIVPAPDSPRLTVTSGQLAYEWSHLLGKLCERDARLHDRWRHLAVPECHPLFELLPGPIAPWERIPADSG